MQSAILGKKIGMTQVFSPEGKLLPVTVIEAGPCIVCQVKTVENDGYSAVQVGYGDIKAKLINKPKKGHFGKSGTTYKRFLREFKLANAEGMKPGDEIFVDVFNEGDKVDVSGISKGKGFAGTIKRHGTHRGPMTHGSHYHRGPGSLGACSSPSKVMKGKKLPGHLGSVKVTVANLTVVKVDKERNLILIKGAVPGAKGSLITIKNTVKS